MASDDFIEFSMRDIADGFVALAPNSGLEDSSGLCKRVVFSRKSPHMIDEAILLSPPFWLENGRFEIANLKERPSWPLEPRAAARRPLSAFFSLGKKRLAQRL